MSRVSKAHFTATKW